MDRALEKPTSIDRSRRYAVLLTLTRHLAYSNGAFTATAAAATSSGIRFCHG